MVFLLSHQNVFDYLFEQKLCTQEDNEQRQVELVFAKNFNLLLSLKDGRKLLIKQERHNQKGETAGEFLNEWQIHKLLQQFPALNHLLQSISEVLHFDADNSLIVFNYLTDYCELADFYAKKNTFPLSIATLLGTTLSTIHRTTLNQHDYRDYFSQNGGSVSTARSLNFTYVMERIGPEIFGMVPADGLKFFTLYQRYDSLGQAIAELSTAFEPCCLTHNDLKLNNILLHNYWEQALSEEQSSHSIVRLIDWERCSWGDPAFDLGTIIASYLQIWLSSLVVSKTFDVEESLRLAMTPLEQIQPSIAALTVAYLSNFPKILERRPHFLRQVVQFSGLALIQQIQAMIQYQKSFGNAGICMLQVAKSLLCRPGQTIPTVFGMTESELTYLSYSPF